MALSAVGGAEEYRIGNHGIIGDTYSAALVTLNGTIDWCAFPRMDSPPVFSSILDPMRGGEFRTQLRGGSEFSQAYRPNTNILKTEMKSPACTVVVEDFMPVEEVDGMAYSRHEIHRLLRCTRGQGTIGLAFRPRFDFARCEVSLREDRFGCIARGGGGALALSVPFGLETGESDATAEISISQGRQLPIVLRWQENKTQLPKMEYSNRMLKETEKFWTGWARETKYDGLWKKQVIRSALTLKLLTYSPTGAICAAATTSLPESIGHGRNWDYRYSWIRDSTYALLSFNALGHKEEETKYFMWLLHLLRGLASRPDLLRIMYTVEGDEVPPEKDVSSLSGYLGSSPVREGNSATGQVQLDIYGSVVEAIYSTFRPPGKLPDMMWRIVDFIAAYIKANWDRPDMGIWEMRNGMERHTHSAVLSWVALSRASHLAKSQGYRGRAEEYGSAAELIRDTVLTRSFDTKLKSFVSSMDGGYLDASVLLMPILGFINPKDRKFIQTLQAVEGHLFRKGFVYRYHGNDGLAGKEGAFIICTFWYISALSRAGQAGKAKKLFEYVLSKANHLGLFSEEMDPDSAEPLGNFPQAFSHMGLIEAAREITAALRTGRKRGGRQ